MIKKHLKTELHHWWPRTLSEHWQAPDHMVSAIRSNGVVRRAPPGAFGGITNAHHMKMGGPWDSTFEPIFNQPDGEMSDFVSWLFTLEAPTVPSARPSMERIAAASFPVARRQQIARITASLLARTPSIRNQIRLGTEFFRGEIGLANPAPDKNLIAANQQGLYDAYRKQMERSGRWAVLFSDSKEFIAGDGFLHNFPASRDELGSGRKLVLPILPTAAIVFMLPFGGHPMDPGLVTLRVNEEEVATLNDIVQIYARDILFFRAEQPVLANHFTIGEHRELKYHQHIWLDGLLDDLSQYNLWGAGGTPGMCRERPYSDAIEGNRMLDRLAGGED